MPASFAYNEPVAEEVYEVMSYRPHWIIRNGNYFFLLILLLFLVLARMIQYPDKIKTSSHLLSPEPLKTVTASIEGRLIKLLVRNEQPVSKGEGLCYIESKRGEFEKQAQQYLLTAPQDGLIMFS